MITEQTFKAGMRRLAGGVCVVSCLHDGQPKGLVATAVNSLSVAPPSLVVCINKSASAHDALLESGAFCVNVLAGHDMDMASYVSHPEHRDARFADPRWLASSIGAPMLKGAAAAFVCRIGFVTAFGTHSIIVGEIVDAEISEGEADALVYVDGQFATVLSPSRRAAAPGTAPTKQRSIAAYGNV